MNSLGLFWIAPGHPITSANLSSDRLAPLQDRCATAQYYRTVFEILAEHDVQLNDVDVLTKIVASCLEVRDLSFAAALEKPDARRLARHFR